MAAYSKARLDALGDGIFSVAMTLLALDVRFPDDFEPRTTAEFLAGAGALWPKFLPYALSFWVLGARWLGQARLRSSNEEVSAEYGRWQLMFLFLVTCVPFTTIAVSRYASLPPAVWLYAGNTALIGLLGLRLLELTPGDRNSEPFVERRVNSAVLVAASLLTIALSFVITGNALLGMLFTAAAPALSRRLAGK